METTEGFYKLEGIDNLLFAPNFIEAPTFRLEASKKDIYTYPVEGWYWFKSIEDAHAFFGLPEPKQEIEEFNPYKRMIL